MLIVQNNLTIRDAEVSDAPQLGIWWRDGKVMAHAGFPRGLSITDDEIASSLVTDTDTTHRLLIISVDSIPVGEMNYRNMGDSIVEIGIKICNFDMHNKGYGHQFLTMLIDELFKNHDYNKIILDTNLKNRRAQHVYEKLGFRNVGVRHDSWQDQLGVLQSAVDYEISRVEWEDIRIEKCGADIYAQTETQTDDAERNNIDYINQKVTLKALDHTNWYKIYALSVSDEQKAFFPIPNVEWIGISRYEEGGTELFAVMIKDEYVGLIGGGYDEDGITGYINPLMIDHRYQGYGYGKQAMLLMIEYLRETLHVTKINIGHRKTNVVAGNLYESLGFRIISTGENECYRQLELIPEKS